MVNFLLAENIMTDLMIVIEETLGLHFPREKWSDLERAVLSIYEDLGYTDVESLAKQIIKKDISRDELETLAAALTVGETYFFREPASLNAFEYNIIPDLIKSGTRRLRIWSAGCATGEEPYTIAMILKKAIPSIEDWDITILATDINMKFIRKALAGVYTRWSFRDVPNWIINKYFVTKSDNQFEISPEIKKMVTFSYLNLMEDNYPSILNDTNAMNVIFCRNVLMYFSEENIRKVVHKFHSSINDGGFFIVSQTELSEYYFGNFQNFPSSGAIIYKKDSHKRPVVSYSSPVLSEPPIKLNKKIPVDTSAEYNENFKSLFIETPLPVKPEVKNSAVNTVEKIRKHYEAGEYDEALDKLTLFISKERGNSEALALIARVYANKGMLGEAEKHCREAVALDDMNPVNYFLLASIYKETGNLVDAVSTLRKAIYLDPGFIMAYYTLGIIAMGQNSKRDAEKNLDTALSLLKKFNSDDYVPESEGIPAGRLAEIVESVKMRL